MMMMTIKSQQNEVNSKSSISQAVLATFYTEEDNNNNNNNNNNKLADKVNLEPSSPQTAVIHSGNNKGKGKSSLKPSCLFSEDKEEIHAFLAQVLNMA